MAKGAVASTHYLATETGADMLRQGGNAFDAAVAAGLVLQVVEPHLNGPGGDLPVIFWKDGGARVLCAQGPAPAGATIDHYRAQGLDLIPGDGLLATVIPGAFDGWMRLLHDHGTMELSDVMAPAIALARDGHPILTRAADAIAGLAGFFRDHWPSSAETWMPGGQPPTGGALFTNPDLAATYARLAASPGDNRQARIRAARDAFYRGFVAERIGRFCADTAVMDASGRAHRGVLTADDMAGYAAYYETPTTFDYHGWTVAKTGPWGQGPVLLQVLAMLAGDDLAAMDPNGPDFAHLLIESQKLALADRDAFYADPDFADVPMAALLSRDYAAARRARIGARADMELRPGAPDGRDPQRAALERLSRPEGAVYEPTMAHLGDAPRGDTVHLDVIDQWGNVVSATPSGGWLQSSPIVPGLGFCLNSRAQMFWLDPDVPGALHPGKRPRTTLSPTLAWHADGRRLSCGTPGGDQQDQWQLLFLLRHLHHGLDLQTAADAPMFHVTHMPSSFYPRTRQPGGVVAEATLPAATRTELTARGHIVTCAPAGGLGRISAASIDAQGNMAAAATTRTAHARAIVV
ncbi:gamma-glutamyltransferase family protein [Paracoccus sp. (in: a-proteobacteria)]|uniref:gamma-glutamyltransferase family protein n=1 Tax=Paracoccus sp. TaxID=267 RepID=UPI0026E0DC5C|nr:gamma-glutamyltransferase family protein [Paracoccus sp. (in: a-proteobacteria)]MDO5647664.1 gamma-glutamyltransferase family protein [Paracoccus sp. (in: a-proteobacteria)]